MHSHLLGVGWPGAEQQALQGAQVAARPCLGQCTHAAHSREPWRQLLRLLCSGSLAIGLQGNILSSSPVLENSKAPQDDPDKCCCAVYSSVPILASAGQQPCRWPAQHQSASAAKPERRCTRVALMRI